MFNDPPETAVKIYIKSFEDKVGSGVSSQMLNKVERAVYMLHNYKSVILATSALDNGKLYVPLYQNTTYRFVRRLVNVLSRAGVISYREPKQLERIVHVEIDRCILHTVKYRVPVKYRYRLLNIEVKPIGVYQIPLPRHAYIVSILLNSTPEKAVERMNALLDYAIGSLRDGSVSHEVVDAVRRKITKYTFSTYRIYHSLIKRIHNIYAPRHDGGIEPFSSLLIRSVYGRFMYRKYGRILAETVLLAEGSGAVDSGVVSYAWDRLVKMFMGGRGKIDRESKILSPTSVAEDLGYIAVFSGMDSYMNSTRYIVDLCMEHVRQVLRVLSDYGSRVVSATYTIDPRTLKKEIFLNIPKPVKLR